MLCASPGRPCPKEARWNGSWHAPRAWTCPKTPWWPRCTYRAGRSTRPASPRPPRNWWCSRDWLIAHQVTRVGIAPTGVYRQVRLLPARRRHGSLAAQAPGPCVTSPDAPPREPMRPGSARCSSSLWCGRRSCRRRRSASYATSYRKAQIEKRTREAQRLDKISQDTGVKLSSVACDILGTSGQAMLAALVAGTTDPQVLTGRAAGYSPSCPRCVRHCPPGLAVTTRCSWP